MKCLSDTVQKGIPEFLKWYDPKFCPQDTILTLDYPVFVDLHEQSGVDAVYLYMKAIWCEQDFLKKFDRTYVIAVLEKAVAGYQIMIENICSIFLINLIGHMAIGKTFDDWGFSQEEYEELTIIFSDQSTEKIEKLVINMIQKMVHLWQEKDVMVKYLCLEARNAAIRIENAVTMKHLDQIFVL